MAKTSEKKVDVATKATRRAPRTTDRLPRIVRIAERLGRRLPDSELRAIPKDLSDQLDHYIYGTPKR
jgi:hypothetical protein